MGRLRETHATQCNEGDPKERENRLPGEVSQHFQTSKKEINSGYCVVAFVDKANVFSSNITASHIRTEEIQNFTLERRSFNFTCLSLNRVCFLLGIYMCFIYII